MASELGAPMRSSLLIVILAAWIVACEDPLKARAVEALGPEALDVPEGPLHRPGEPCVLCHDGDVARAFSLGGTVYVAPDSERPAPGASVALVDASGARFAAITNCAGNFFVLPEDFQPVYPLWAALRLGAHEIVMESPIHEDGSCAGCHGREAGPESAGGVYLFPIAPEPLDEGCP
jgi:hypothetical protein